MSIETINIKNEAHSEQLGNKLGQLLQPGDVVGLRGDLGAGKTYLCRAVARSMGVPLSHPVSSPTFTLINEYHGGRLSVYHMDFYRLVDATDLYDLGIWEYYEGNGVCLVEWFDKFEDFWPAEALTITLSLGGEQHRRVALDGEGRGAYLVDKLAKWHAAL